MFKLSNRLRDTMEQKVPDFMKSLRRNQDRIKEEMNRVVIGAISEMQKEVQSLEIQFNLAHE